jgi:hypothetical protein
MLDTKKDLIPWATPVPVYGECYTSPASGLIYDTFDYSHQSIWWAGDFKDAIQASSSWVGDRAHGAYGIEASEGCNGGSQAEKQQAEMHACGFLADKEKMYSRCMSVNHPSFHDGDHSRWGNRGTSCTALVKEQGALVSYVQSYATEADAYIRQSGCVAKAGGVGCGPGVVYHGKLYESQCMEKCKSMGIPEGCNYYMLEI